MSASITASSTSLSTKATLGFNFGRSVWVSWHNGTAEVGTRQQFLLPMSGPMSVSLPAPTGVSGAHTLKVWSAASGGTAIAQSAPITIGSGTAAAGSLIRCRVFRIDQWFRTNDTVTSQSTWGLESGFTSVRLVFGNNASSYPVVKALVAPSATPGVDGAVPVDGTGKAVPWTPVTFNAAGNVVPSPSAADEIAYLRSDWIPLASIARSDGGTLPLLTTRVYTNTEAAWQALGGDLVAWDQTASVSQGRIIMASSISQDYVTTNTVAFTPAHTGYLMPFGVEYQGTAKGYNVLALGDSLTQGWLTPSNSNGYPHIMCCAASTPAKPVSLIQGAWEGQTTTQYLSRGRAMLASFTPDVVIICVTSPNDGKNAQADLNAMLAAARSVADYAKTLGTVPILATAVPWPNYTAEGDVSRKNVNDQVRALGTAGTYLVLDADVAVTDGGTPARIQTKYLANDNAHMNDAGQAAIAAANAGLFTKAGMT